VCNFGDGENHYNNNNDRTTNNYEKQAETHNIKEPREKQKYTIRKKQNVKEKIDG
jgi:hypothetical protein